MLHWKLSVDGKKFGYDLYHLKLKAGVSPNTPGSTLNKYITTLG
jgi:hypothetical protein